MMLLSACFFFLAGRSVCSIVRQQFFVQLCSAPRPPPTCRCRCCLYNRFLRGSVLPDVFEAYARVVQPRTRAMGSGEQGSKEKDKGSPVHRKVCVNLCLCKSKAEFMVLCR